MLGSVGATARHQSYHDWLMSESGSSGGVLSGATPARARAGGEGAACARAGAARWGAGGWAGAYPPPRRATRVAIGAGGGATSDQGAPPLADRIRPATVAAKISSG